jgi:HTH-type transcriptional regulator / antitoxin HigA
MIEATANRYIPDEVSPPGETLQETLEMLGMSQAELAERTGRPKQAINEIVRGKKEITAQTALQLEQVLGIPASFWLAREQNYREALARRAQTINWADDTDLLRQFPVKKMVEFGWLKAAKSKVDQLRELLGYFGAAGPEQLKSLCLHQQAAFRKSDGFEADTGALNAWLRRGELIGQQTDTKPYSEDRFLQALRKARALTRSNPSEFLEPLRQLCAEAGVVVAFVRELPKIRASGATRWLKPDKALIQLSLRFKWADQVWFSFFHEAGHIVLHGKTDVFLDLVNGGTTGEREEEADRFARNLLIPPEDWEHFVGVGYFGAKSVTDFANRQGVSPGIVVGRLQHERRIQFSKLTHLKPRFEWAKGK